MKKNDNSGKTSDAAAKGRILMISLAIALASVFAVSLICASEVTDASTSFTSDGLNYEITSDTEVKLIYGSYAGSVVIPSSVTYSDRTYTVTAIGDGAFDTNHKINSVSIPATVKSIGTKAFFYCYHNMLFTVDSANQNFCSNYGVLFTKDMKTLISYPIGVSDSKYEIPSSVTAIADYAFYDAVHLKSIAIGANVKTIGQQAFTNCLKNEEFTVDADNKNYSSADGILFNKDKTVLIDYPLFKKINDYTIPDTVVTISDYAFCGCTNIVYLTAGDNLKTIGDYAFAECKGLLYLTVGAGVKTIGDMAFDNCITFLSITVSEGNAYYSTDNGILFNKDKTVLIKCPASAVTAAYTLPSTVTDIADYAFQNSLIKAIVFQDSLKTIGAQSFYNSSLASITIPDNVETIGEKAFYNTLAASVSIGSGVTSIGEGAFHYNLSLSSITVSSGNSNYSSEDGVLFNKNKTLLIQYPAAKNDTSYSVPDTVTEIADCAFYMNGSITSVNIPDSVESIGKQAFYTCRSMNTIIFGTGLTYIGSEAFCKCIGLTSLTIGSGVKTIGDNAFNSCLNLSSITIPNGVTAIGDYAFYKNAFAVIEIPASVTSLGDLLFYECKELASITVDPSNNNYCSVDGILFNKDMTALICYPASKTSDTYTIPNTVRTIAEAAFAANSYLASVSIPASVTSIEDNALYKTALNSVTVDANNQKYSSENGVLFSKDKSSLIYYPTKKTDVTYTVPGSVRIIESNAFYNCTTLRSVIVSEGVTTLGTDSMRIPFLESITLPSTLRAIDENAFRNCSSLETVVLPEDLTYIAANAFYGTGVKLISAGSVPASLGMDAFGLAGYAEQYVPYDSIAGSSGYAVKWSQYTEKLIPCVNVPTARSLVYNGTEQTAVDAMPGVYSVTDNTGICVGSYTASAALQNDIHWFDTTQGVKTIDWSISPKQVTVKADDISKRAGTDDPMLTATVIGVVEGDTVEYSLVRAIGEEAKTYNIMATGEAVQGNYIVTYENGTFTIEEDLAGAISLLWIVPAVLLILMIIAMAFISSKKG